MGSRLEAGSNATRKRIENHEFTNEEGEEYGASKFGGFGDYFRRKKIKLQNLDAEIRSSSPDKPQIFYGVIAHVNGYTQPSLNDLHRMIVSHGGGFLQYLDGKTAATHIIASALTPKKREEFRRYRIVKPRWVVESIQAGRLLPWESFRLIDEGVSQKVLNFDPSGKITSRVSHQSPGYRSQTDSSWYSSQIRKDSPRDDSPTKDDIYSSPTPKTASPLRDETKSDTAKEIKLSSIHPASDDIVDEQDPEHRRSISQSKPTAVKEQSEPTELVQNRKNTTSEDLSALPFSDPRKRSSDIVNPDFIKQYYQESRLHHLSTWKAELKAQLQKLTQGNGTPRPSTKRLPPGSRRYILHVDFDSFFAAVSLKKHPELVSKPVAIAHGTGPGSEIASCNYPARTFGVKNGMWMKGALQLCPELKVMPYDFAAYEDASRKFYESILSIGGVVQSVSIDEALIDVTPQCITAGGSDGKAISEGSIWREQEMADNIAQGLRDSVKQKTDCNVSVGIGGNILQAKLALKKAKPAGQFQLKPEELLEFIGEFTVRDLPGVAHSLGAKLEELGVKFVKDIRQLTKERLISHLGPKTGAKLWDYARGFDNTEVGEQVVRKSVSAEINWGIRFINQTQAEEFVQGLCDELHRRLVDNVVKGKQLTMKIMRRSADAPVEPPKHLGHGKCDTFNKSIILGVSTNNSETIGKEAISILRSFNFPPSDLRGLGVQMTKLEPIKASVKGGQEGSSQRQLQFRASSPMRTEASPDPDEIVTPKKGDASTQYIPNSLKSGLSLNDASHKPLNVTGTQFILPSQTSPTVLTELPEDIRSQFAPRERPSISERLKAAATTTQKPRSPFASTALPPQSQLDHETLNALPGDVRDEVLSYYNQTADIPNEPSWPRPGKQHGTMSKSSRKPTTPTKSRVGRGRGRPSTSAKSNATSTLTQSNFIFSRPTSSTSLPEEEMGTVAPDSAKDTAGEEISSEFLDALPDDIRREVLEEHKRTRLQKHAGLNLPVAKTKKPGSPKQQPPEQKPLSFPPPPAKPTFTSKKLSSLPELREALSEWYSAFKSEGPYEEDIGALTRYLQRVIAEEKDIAKAVDLARWLAWLNEDNLNQPCSQDSDKQDSGQDQSPLTWSKAVDKVRDVINVAVKERGLPAVEFD